VTGEKIAYPGSGRAEGHRRDRRPRPGRRRAGTATASPSTLVTAGKLTVEYEGGGPRSSSRATHSSRRRHGPHGRNAGSEPVRLLVFYTGVVGAPNVEKAKGPFPGRNDARAGVIPPAAQQGALRGVVIAW